MIDSRLITEVQTDPLARGYAAMSAEQIRVSLYDTVDRAVRVLVPLWEIKERGMKAGWWMPMRAAALASDAAAMAFMEYYSDQRFENIDMDLTATQTVLAWVVASSLLTEPQVAELDAMADSTITRAAELGLPEYHAGDIATIGANT